jgi:hypothetical protein
MVAGLAGIIGGGIGYGLAPTAPQPAVAAAAPAEPETEAADATPAARPDRADRAERKRTRKRPQAVASGPVDLSEVRGEEWVTIHDPQQTWPGYTLVFYQRRLPMLIDMSGRIVHYWPEVRGVGRARLTAEGNLVYIASDDAVREVDWNGKLVREYKSDVEGRFPHHDLQWVPDGRIASIYRTKSEFTDDVVLLGKSGEELWTWKSRGHLDADFPTSREESKDLTHFNSVQVIPENPHQRAGDQRFKAGNILISARHLNHIYMVDPDTGEVVWKYGDGLDWQHEATMLGDDSPSPGNILLFNNRYHSEDRRSEVIEINPTTNEVVWRYSVEGFFSDTAGVAQKLPNGNVLITSSRGGRLFEVTASGEVVWQWQPPYLPMRVNRYAPDYCPQLAAMGPPSGGPVTSKETGGPFIDSALYDFKLAEGVRRVMVGVKKRDVLTSGKVCHDVQLPGKPSIVLDIGFVMPAGDTPPAMDGTVKVTVAPEGGAAEVVLEKDVSPAEDGGWLRERARIPKPMAYQKVEICVESSSPDITSREDLRPGLVVGAPKIISGFRSSAKNLPSVRDKGTQRAERDLQQRQLEALGYIE